MAWSGYVIVNHEDDDSPHGSRITGIGGGIYSPESMKMNVDYSFGYSVPITCNVGGNTIMGCNIELFDRGMCKGNGDKRKKDVCKNGAASVGPASDFFKPCQGFALLFQNDNNMAFAFGENAKKVDCCVGKTCPAATPMPAPTSSAGVA